MNRMCGWVCICGTWHSANHPDEWCSYYKEHYAARLQQPTNLPPKPKVAPEEFEI